VKKKMNPKETRKALIWHSLRLPSAVIGLVLLIVGQLQMADKIVPLSAPLQLGKWLNENWHLDIPSIDNILHGLPILLIGVILLAIGLRGLKLVSVDSFIIEPKQIGLQLIRSAWPWIVGALVIFSILILQLSKLNYQALSPILWLVTLIIFATTTAAWDRRRGVSISPRLTRKDLIWLTGLVLVGLIIGTYRLQGMPDQLIGDEGNFWTTARDIAAGSYKPPIFGNGTYSFPIFSSILQAVVLRLFGISLWGWRLSSVLPGIITVVPLYLLARDAFDRKIAIASSIALFVSPYYLAFSRLGYIIIQAIFIATLTFYWLYNGVQRSSSFLLFLAGCAAGFGFYTFFAARGIFVVAGVFVVLLWMTKKIKFRQAAFALVMLSIGIFLVAAPYFVYGTHENAQSMGFKVFEAIFFNVFNGRQFYMDSELFKYAPLIHIGGNDLFFNPSIYAVLIIRGLIRTVLALQTPFLVTEHFIASPLTGTVGVVFYLLGLGVALKTIKEPRSQLILIWFLTNIFGFSALNTVPPRQTHMIAIIPALALLIGMGINALARAIGQIHPWIRERIVYVFSILLAAVMVGGIVDYFVTVPRKYLPQSEEIMSWAVLESHGEQFLYVTNDPADADFIPYIKREFLKSVPFSTIQLSQLLDGSISFRNASKTIIFYPPDLAPQITPLLKTQWGSKFIERTFLSTSRSLVLTAGMNEIFTFEQDRSFTTTLLDSYHYPSLIVLLVLLVISLALFVFLPSSWVARLPGRLKPLADWYNREEPSKVEESEEESVFSIDASLTAELAQSAKEPPDWVSEFSDSKSFKDSRLPRSEFKLVKTELGRDIYIKIFLPAFTFPWRQPSREFEFSIPALRFPNTILLVLSVFIALVAQLLVSDRNYPVAAMLYLLSASGLFIWAIKNPRWKNVFVNQLRISPRVESWIVAAIMITAAFLRFYDLPHRIYGLAVGETRWTIQSWYSAILQVDKGELASIYYKYLPVDFWLKSFFLRLFGLNFISARIESAFFSLLSVGLLYLLVRRLSSSKPLALLASLLYTFSFTELTFSHQALAETSPEIWIFSGFALFLLALQEQKWWQFQLTGVVLAIGMLSYDTFLPTVVIILLYLLAFGLYRMIKHKAAVKKWLEAFLLTAWPVVLVYFDFTDGYLASRLSEQFGVLVKSFSGGSNLIAFFHILGQNITDLLTTIFSQVAWRDILVNWTGPFVNPLLLPFIVIGLVYNLWNLRRPHFALLPLWFLGNIALAPILLGPGWPWVLYTNLTPLIIWGAMGLWTLLGALRAWLEISRLKLAITVFAMLIIGIFLNDYHIFTSSLVDPVDRQKRRELADLTIQSTSHVPMILFPFEPNQGDMNEGESPIISFSVAGRPRFGLQADQLYKQIPFDQTLLTLWQDRKLPAIDLVYDKTAASRLDQRSHDLEIVVNCYPGAVLKTSGHFFDVYHFNAQTLNEPTCYQSAIPEPIAPADGAVLSSGNPLTFSWNSNGAASSSFNVSVQLKAANTFLIEAENVFQSSGWYLSPNYVSGYSGSGFIEDQWHAGITSFNFQAPENNQYRVWIRTYKRRENDQHNFISMNGQTIEFAKNGNTLDAWVWEDLGTFTLNRGSVPISLSRTYGQDEEYSVFIDSMLITSDLQQSPSELKDWINVFDSGEITSPTNQYQLAQTLPAGVYRWSVHIYDGDRLIDATGARGIQTPYSTFTIK
jgi:4-amino-4-deoxy-L-arabinose transferase-like glycosyltransferase